MLKARGKLGIATIGMCITLVACGPIVKRHGYVPSEEELAEVIVGVDTRDSVESLIGPPSSSGVIRDTAWYYLSSTRVSVGPLAPRETERNLLAISFDEAGTVTNLERFGLDDGRVIVINRRVTDDNIQGISFIRQLLGNIGNINAEDFLGDG